MYIHTYIPFSYANVSSLNQRMNLDDWARTTEALDAMLNGNSAAFPTAAAPRTTEALGAMLNGNSASFPTVAPRVGASPITRRTADADADAMELRGRPTVSSRGRVNPTADRNHPADLAPAQHAIPRGADNVHMQQAVPRGGSSADEGGGADDAHAQQATPRGYSHSDGGAGGRPAAAPLRGVGGSGAVNRPGVNVSLASRGGKHIQIYIYIYIYTHTHTHIYI